MNGIVLSCEHASNVVPAEYQRLFKGKEKLLQTHKGWDPGAIVLAQALATRFKVPLIAGTATRLLIELNRTIGHRTLFSSITSALRPQEKALIIKRFWRPYVDALEAEIDRAISEHGHALHLSIHTFTPNLDGSERTAEIGLLYDPKSPEEKLLAKRWKEELQRALPKGFRIRYNYPYLGNSSSMTAYFRKRYASALYSGILLEVNQKDLTPETATTSPLVTALCHATAATITPGYFN